VLVERQTERRGREIKGEEKREGERERESESERERGVPCHGLPHGLR
jgi:hypothetical protein